MMYIITSENPKEAVEFLIENTSKQFSFKQLIELSQLLAGCGITNQMKPIKQGKKLQEWIKENPVYTYSYFKHLFKYCLKEVNMQQQTKVKLKLIENDLLNYIVKNNRVTDKITNAVFRYKKGYSSKFETNSLLPISIACNEYRNYIKNYKFKNV